MWLLLACTSATPPAGDKPGETDGETEAETGGETGDETGEPSGDETGETSGDESDSTQETAPPADQDGDGFDDTVDCDDADAGVGLPFAGATCADPDGACEMPDEHQLLVPDEYPSIQDAIDAATSGQEVCVAPGTYPEVLNFGGKDLVVRGGMGPGATVVDGGGAGPIVTFRNEESGDAVLEGFTLQNGVSEDGGAILLDGTEALAPVLRNLVLTGNYARDDGGALYATLASPTLEDVLFVGNTSGDSAGGARLVYTTATLLRCTFEDNVAGGAAGGLAIRESNPLISELRVAGNVAGVSGGGIDLFSAGGTWVDLVIEDNVAAVHGGGVYFGGSRDLAWSRVEISGNRADGDGGGIYLGWPVPFVLTQAVFVDNVAGGDGSAIGIEEACTLTFANLSVARNEGDCGSIAVLGPCVNGTGGPPTLTSSILAANVGATAGGLCGLLEARIAVSYSDFYDNGTNFSGMEDDLGRLGNVGEPPAFVTWGAALDRGHLDLHLAGASPMIDLGDPGDQDPDGSRADMGAYGGAGAEQGWYDDADADGLPDGWEADHGLSLVDDDANGDPDADGASNTVELAAGTWPEEADTDGDGQRDGDELLGGSDPLDPGA